MKEPPKFVQWPLILEKDILNNVYHSIFLLGPPPDNTNIVGETLDLFVAGENIKKYLGTGEVSSVKICRIRDIDPIDLARQKMSFKTKVGTVKCLRIIHPDTKVNLDSIVTVVTIKRNTYDLKELNRMVKLSDKKVVKKRRQM